MTAKDIIVEEVLPIGSTVINHMVRVKLKLSITEYCVVDTILKRKKLDKKTTIGDIYSYIGIDPNDLQKISTVLESRSIIKVINGEYFVNNKIPLMIKEIEKNEYEDEFEEFWTEEKNGKLITAWPGPKKDAFEKFKLARKSYSFLHIINQKKAYFAHLSDPNFKWKQKMIATKFLNIKTGQIEEDWSLYSKPKVDAQKVGREKLTESQKMDLYK